MSPAISTVPAIDPSQAPVSAAGGGLIPATGTPRLVTRIGTRVRCTRSKTARQVALNFDIDIWSIPYSTMVRDRGRTDGTGLVGAGRRRCLPGEPRRNPDRRAGARPPRQESAGPRLDVTAGLVAVPETGPVLPRGRHADAPRRRLRRLVLWPSRRRGDRAAPVRRHRRHRQSDRAAACAWTPIWIGCSHLLARERVTGGNAQPAFRAARR